MFQSIIRLQDDTWWSSDVGVEKQLREQRCRLFDSLFFTLRSAWNHLWWPNPIVWQTVTTLNDIIVVTLESSRKLIEIYRDRKERNLLISKENKVEIDWRMLPRPQSDLVYSEGLCTCTWAFRDKDCWYRVVVSCSYSRNGKRLGIQEECLGSIPGRSLFFFQWTIPWTFLASSYLVLVRNTNAKMTIC